MAEKEQRVKRVYEMPEVSAPQEEVITEYRQKRVVAYCRVSTKQEGLIGRNAHSCWRKRACSELKFDCMAVGCFFASAAKLFFIYDNICQVLYDTMQEMRCGI